MPPLDSSLSQRSARRQSYQRLLLNSAIYIVVFLIVVVIVWHEPNFLSFNNFRYILTQSSTRIIMALGVAGIIVLGGTDLSVGRMIGMSAVVTASLLQTVGAARRIYPEMAKLPIAGPILLVMILCALFSILHAISVFKFKVAPFIASLAIQLIVYGSMSLYFEQANSGSPIGNLDRDFTRFAQGAWNIAGYRLPYILVYALIAVAVMWIVWNKTELGKNMFAIGGNREAATVCGVNILKNAVFIYIIAGLLYGVAGSLEVARTGSATNGLGQGYELDSIASCVVGGVSMRGGVGTISGVVTGVLLFQVINYGLVYIGVSPYIQYIVKGMIILVAVAIDTQKYEKKK